MRKLFFLSLILLLGACSDIGYYWHSTKGHLALMNKRVDIEALLEQPDLEAGLRQRLQLVQQIRAFSVDALSLPDTGSYTNYAQLEKPYVVQNLFAAGEFSTTLHSWCYPIAGCVNYRGYYDEVLLDEFADRLKAKNFDIHIAYVPAYSTLGWFDDPVLSSFIDWPDYRLAGLLFHELTHQRIYIDDDTLFNESLAVAVQLAGTELWLKSVRDEAQMEEFRRWIEYRREVILLIENTGVKLRQLYESEMDDAIKRDNKQAIFTRAREGYAAIAKRLNYRDGFEGWFAGELNNASIGSIAAYNTHAPAFMKMIEVLDYDFSAFFDAVEQIGGMDRAARDQCLDLWAGENAINDDRCPKIALP